MTTRLPPRFPAFHWRCLTLLLLFSLYLTPVKGAIQLFDGPSDPVYPEESPDPWTVPGTLIPNGTLIISAGSRVNAGTLALGGRTIVQDSTTVLQADVLDFQGTRLNNVPSSDLFVQAGAVQAGFIEERAETTMFLRAWDFGSITVSQPGGIGDDSTTVISLEIGGSIEAIGNQAFGGDRSSFSLGPGGGDRSIIVAKARIADAAMQNITEYIPSYIDIAPRSKAPSTTGTGFPQLENTIGRQTTFRVEGDARIAGQTSDALIHLTAGSVFEVTGNLNGLNSESIFNTVIINSDFIVGGSATFIDGDKSSNTTFVGSSNVDIGGDWTLGNGAASVSTFNSINSHIEVEGSLLMNFRGGSAMESTTTNSTLIGGGDFSIGGPDTDNSAISFAIEDSNFDFDGSLTFEISSNSVMSGLITGGSSIQLGGDLVFKVSGNGQSTDVLSIEDSAITTGGSILIDSRTEGISSSTLDVSELTLAVGMDFRIHRPGNTSDNTTSIIGTTGSIGRDLHLDLSAFRNSQSICVLSGMELTIGRDFLMTTRPAPMYQICAADLLTLEIERDWIIGEDFFFRLASSTLTVKGDAEIAGRLLPSGITINGDVHVSNTGNLQLTWTEESVANPLTTINGAFTTDPNGETTVILQAASLPGEFILIRHTGTDPLHLGGRLAVHFAHGYQDEITADTRIPLIRSNLPITGAYANATPGQRFPTADGRGSFLLDTNGAGTELYLTNFEPTTPSAPVIRKAAADFQNGALFVKWSPFGNGEFYRIQTRSDLLFGSWTTMPISPPSFATSAYLSIPESAETLFVRILENEEDKLTSQKKIR